VTTFKEDLAFIDSLSREDKINLMESLKNRQPSLVTHPGPQTMAAESEADLTLYGGAAGGGKTFLAIILALTKHRRTLIIRKEASQLYAMQDEIETILGGREGFNSQNGIWRLPNNEITDPYDEKPTRQIRFGGLNKPGDAAKYQGAPRDLLVIDEAANISYGEFSYLTVWERTASEGQKTRTLLCSNPPTDATGMWMVRIFRPWLDPDHDNPAVDGELRWFVIVEDDDYEVECEGDYIIDRDDGMVRLALPEEMLDSGNSIYSAQSRTFISAKVDDNPHMIQSGYKQKLQRLPKHLRERMLDGKFLSSLEDDQMQVIPSEWVDLAMQRWKDSEDKSYTRMSAMGVDPARGGQDEMTIMTRHGFWYSPIMKIPGKEVPTGSLSAARVVMARRDGCRVYCDVIGIGSSTYDKLVENHIDVDPIVGNEGSDAISKDGLFHFRNLRAELFWRLRESLDPESGDFIMLPPDKKMKEDLCAFKYKILEGNVIQVESKKEVKMRLNRSPDAGDCVLYTSRDAPMLSDLRKGSKQFKVRRCLS